MFRTGETIVVSEEIDMVLKTCYLTVVAFTCLHQQPLV